MSTLPKNAVLIMQKDVQLFIFWAMRYAEKRREDITVVARGLAGSPWYIQMREDEKCPVKMGQIRTEDDIERFLKDNPNREVFAGWEEDVPVSSKYRQIPIGLLRKITLHSVSGAAEFLSAPNFLKELYVYRGKKYNYQSQSEFFSSDIVDDYSKAHFGRGIEFFVLKKLPEAREEWNRAISLNSDNPSNYYRRAFLNYEEKRFDQAMLDFVRSEHLYEKTYKLTQEYFSLPDVVRGVQTEWADVLMNMGVVYEKMGEKEKSENAYLKSLKVNPNSAQAHYNLAVLYWNRDWRKVVEHLQACLRIDPANQQARAFFDKAVYALQRSQVAR